MRKMTLASLATFVVILTASVLTAQARDDKSPQWERHDKHHEEHHHGPPALHHIRADLVSIDGSGVTGFVELTDQPHGETSVHVVARGLLKGTTYAAFHSESGDCSAPADLLAKFTANRDGVGEVHGKIDDGLDEIGSITIRLGRGHDGTLLACASVAQDNTAPTVSSTIPVDGATGVPLDQVLSAVFSEAMDPLTISTSSFTLKHGTTLVTGTVGYSGVTATFTPTANLAPLTVYTATITTKAKDLAGNALDKKFAWSFTTGSTAEIIAPMVSSTVPANAATGVGISGKLTATFSKAMDPLTITAASFTLKQGTAAVAGTVSYTGVTATFTPTSNLAPNTLYTATITTAAKDLDGNALAADFVWSFTTGSTADIIAPTVSSTVPVNAATAVAISGKLTATFSEAMDPSTISIASFTLKHGTTVDAGTVSYAGVTATFSPTGNLAPSTLYTATITTASKDLAGNALAADFVWSFTTGSTADVTAPTVSSTIPVNAATDVAFGDKVTATFSEAMDPLTITTTSFTLKHGTIGVAGMVSYAGVTAAFTPMGNLAPLTAYTATISTVASDLAGNALATDYVWTFTTGSTPDVTAPNVSSTVPPNTATDVPLGSGLAVTFSEAMDPLTITTTSFTLKHGTIGVAGTVSYAGVTATFTPVGNLAPLTAYAATISTVARDLAGNALLTDYSWTFTTGSTPDIIAPTVSSTVPLNTATDVALSSGLAATFSEAMNPLTISTASFTLRQGATPIAGTVSYAGVTATFTPAASLALMTVYTATVTTGVKDLAGNALVTNYSWSFTTGSTPDIIAPTVSSTAPFNEETGVAISTKVAAAFSEAMNPLTISTSSFTLKQGATPIAGTVSYAGVTATFTPATNLLPLTVYAATITTAAKDLAGNAVVTNFTWSFNTGSTPDVTAPTVSATVPVNAATNVALSGKLTAAFSEAMDPLTINTTSFTLKQGVTLVTGTVSYLGVTATFTPLSNLASTTVYTATISTGAKDLAGNALLANSTWSFTTGSGTDNIAPTVTSTIPAGGSTAVGINQAINASFSEAMDPLTLNTASVTLTGPGAALVPGTVSYDVVDKIASFKPTANLTATTAYTATITTAAKDLAGNALATNFIWSFTTGSTSAGQAPVALGAASTFAVLGGSTVTNTGQSIVTGDLGLSPGTAVTGFPPGIVNGSTHAGDPAAAQAQLALTAAYIDAAGRTVGAISAAGNLGGQTLTPGLYKSTSSLEISSGDLTLDAQGDANAVFIFQVATTLTTTAGRQVILSGGAKAANIFWQVGSSATLGSNSVFKGNILALVSISVTTGAVVDGRLLARNAGVALDGGHVGLGSVAPATIIASVPGASALGAAADAVVGVPNRVSLTNSNPLRFGPATIHFGLAQADRVEINVYDVGGRVVSRLVDQGFEPGEHEVQWNRLDQSGSPVPSGLYFTKVSYGNQRFEVTKKLVIVE